MAVFMESVHAAVDAGTLSARGPRFVADLVVVWHEQAGQEITAPLVALALDTIQRLADATLAVMLARAAIGTDDGFAPAFPAAPSEVEAGDVLLWPASDSAARGGVNDAYLGVVTRVERGLVYYRDHEGTGAEDRPHPWGRGEVWRRRRDGEVRDFERQRAERDAVLNVLPHRWWALLPDGVFYGLTP